MKKKKKERDVLTEISASFPEGGQPENAAELINAYGTYEVQKTADTENQYPAIAQGYNPGIVKYDGENKRKN